jgi:hypothetical protein
MLCYDNGKAAVTVGRDRVPVSVHKWQSHSDPNLEPRTFHSFGAAVVRDTLLLVLVSTRCTVCLSHATRSTPAPPSQPQSQTQHKHTLCGTLSCSLSLHVLLSRAVPELRRVCLQRMREASRRIVCGTRTTRASSTLVSGCASCGPPCRTPCCVAAVAACRAPRSHALRRTRRCCRHPMHRSRVRRALVSLKVPHAWPLPGLVVWRETPHRTVVPPRCARRGDGLCCRHSRCRATLRRVLQTPGACVGPRVCAAMACHVTRGCDDDPEWQPGLGLTRFCRDVLACGAAVMCCAVM